MKPILLAAGSVLAAWAGMTVLCFQSPSQRHRMRLPEHTSRQRLLFAASGATLLAISLMAAIVADGASFGIVLWLCQTGILGLVLTCMLPYSVMWVTQTSRIAAVVALVLLASGNWL